MKAWNGYFKIPEFLSFSTSELLGVIDSLGLPIGSKVLDLGCGYTKLSRKLDEKGYVVWAVDNSEKIIDKVRETKPKFMVEIGDAFNLRFKDNFFDLVITDGLLEHFKDDEEIVKILKEERRVSKKYVINFMPSDIWFNKFYAFIFRGHREYRNKDWINLHQWVFSKAKNTKLSRLTALVCEVNK